MEYCHCNMSLFLFKRAESPGTAVSLPIWHGKLHESCLASSCNSVQLQESTPAYVASISGRWHACLGCIKMEKYRYGLLHFVLWSVWSDSICGFVFFLLDLNALASFEILTYWFLLHSKSSTVPFFVYIVAVFLLFNTVQKSMAVWNSIEAVEIMLY